MSTYDCPGENPANHDKLAMGCWAEHADGSLMLVESTEGDRVIYSMFDMDKNPPIEYRDAMSEISFKSTFTWKPGDDKKGWFSKKIVPNEKWLWHDKTPFPWDRIIKAGVSDGPRYPSAAHTISAAERVAQSLRLRGQEYDRRHADHRVDKAVDRAAAGIWNRIRAAVVDNLDESAPKHTPKIKRTKIRGRRVIKRASARA